MDEGQGAESARYATKSLFYYCEPEARLTFPLYIVLFPLYIKVPSGDLLEVLNNIP